jgi:hypothetical protein
MADSVQARPGYYPSPWPCEDGGPQRLQTVQDLPGPGLQPHETLRSRGRSLRYVIMVLLRDPGEVYAMAQEALRGRFLGLPIGCRIEKLDPESLRPIRRSPRLAGGPFWAGGFCIHRNGDLYVTIGRRMHRLDPDCEPVASYELPVNLPYNSHLVLDNGCLVTKSYGSRERSVMTVLDPATLEEVCPHVEMPEPSIARISARGNTVYVVGIRSVFRYHWDERAARPVLDDSWRFDYVGDSRQEYGWDPVVDDENVWFMDNGRHRMLLSMVKAGVSPTPLNFVRVSLADASDHTIQPVSGLPRGSITNPPFYCPERRILVAYDSANRVSRAWRHHPAGNRFEPLWEKRPFGSGGHMIYWQGSGELVSNDYRPWRGDTTVLLDLETGAEKGRVRLHNFQQGLGFSCPGWSRDFYFVGVDKLVRVCVG